MAGTYDDAIKAVEAAERAAEEARDARARAYAKSKDDVQQSMTFLATELNKALDGLRKAAGRLDKDKTALLPPAERVGSEEYKADTKVLAEGPGAAGDELRALVSRLDEMREKVEKTYMTVFRSYGERTVRRTASGDTSEHIARRAGGS